MAHLFASTSGQTNPLTANGASVSKRIQIADWTLVPGAARVLRGQVSHQLNPKELGVLLHLVQSAPDYVPGAELLARSWSGSLVGDNALHQVIARLRRIMGDNARKPRYIETLPRLGYRLLPEVSVPTRQG